MHESLSADPHGDVCGAPCGRQTAASERCAAKAISNENQSDIREGVLIAIAARKPSSG
jgi:hypothetical protein